MIHAEDIQKKYGDLPVLRGVNLEINRGEFVCIVGPSGAGKTTLLQILGTLDKPDHGTLLFNNVDVFGLGSRKLAHFRNKHIGFVFQFHQLLPEFTAVENVALAARIGGIPAGEAKKQALMLLERMGLKDRIQHKPGELSGGEQQRVAVCRALINKPDLILADEPTGNLDSANAQAMHALFLELREEFKQTFVIVTHNEELAASADRTLSMKDGLIL
jgi:lipoprotein-releasing system ATP-binding protein